MVDIWPGPVCAQASQHSHALNLNETAFVLKNIDLSLLQIWNLKDDQPLKASFPFGLIHDHAQFVVDKLVECKAYAGTSFFYVLIEGTDNYSSLISNCLGATPLLLALGR